MPTVEGYPLKFHSTHYVCLHVERCSWLHMASIFTDLSVNYAILLACVTPKLKCDVTC